MNFLLHQAHVRPLSHVVTMHNYCGSLQLLQASVGALWIEGIAGSCIHCTISNPLVAPTRYNFRNRRRTLPIRFPPLCCRKLRYVVLYLTAHPETRLIDLDLDYRMLSNEQHITNSKQSHSRCTFSFVYQPLTPLPPLLSSLRSTRYPRIPATIPTSTPRSKISIGEQTSGSNE